MTAAINGMAPPFGFTSNWPILGYEPMDKVLDYAYNNPEVVYHSGVISYFDNGCYYSYQYIGQKVAPTQSLVWLFSQPRRVYYISRSSPGSNPVVAARVALADVSRCRGMMNRGTAQQRNDVRIKYNLYMTALFDLQNCVIDWFQGHWPDEAVTRDEWEERDVHLVVTPPAMQVSDFWSSTYNRQSAQVASTFRLLYYPNHLDQYSYIYDDPWSGNVPWVYTQEEAVFRRVFATKYDYARVLSEALFTTPDVHVLAESIVYAASWPQTLLDAADTFNSYLYEETTGPLMQEIPLDLFALLVNERGDGPAIRVTRAYSSSVHAWWELERQSAPSTIRKYRTGGQVTRTMDVNVTLGTGDDLISTSVVAGAPKLVTFKVAAALFSPLRISKGVTGGLVLRNMDVNVKVKFISGSIAASEVPVVVATPKLVASNVEATLFSPLRISKGVMGGLVLRNMDVNVKAKFILDSITISGVPVVPPISRRSTIVRARTSTVGAITRGVYGGTRYVDFGVTIDVATEGATSIAKSGGIRTVTKPVNFTVGAKLFSTLRINKAGTAIRGLSVRVTLRGFPNSIKTIAPVIGAVRSSNVHLNMSLKASVAGPQVRITETRASVGGKATRTFAISGKWASFSASTGIVKGLTGVATYYDPTVDHIPYRPALYVLAGAGGAMLPIVGGRLFDFEHHDVTSLLAGGTNLVKYPTNGITKAPTVKDKFNVQNCITVYAVDHPNGILFAPDTPTGFGYACGMDETIECWFGYTVGTSNASVGFFETMLTDSVGSAHPHTRIDFDRNTIYVTVAYGTQLSYKFSAPYNTGLAAGTLHHIKLDRRGGRVPGVDRQFDLYVDGISVEDASWTNLTPRGVASNRAVLLADGTPCTAAYRLFPGGLVYGVQPKVFFHDLLVTVGNGRFGNFGIPTKSFGIPVYTTPAVTGVSAPVVPAPVVSTKVGVTTYVASTVRMTLNSDGMSLSSWIEWTGAGGGAAVDLNAVSRVDPYGADSPWSTLGEATRLFIPSYSGLLLQSDMVEGHVQASSMTVAEGAAVGIISSYYRATIVAGAAGALQDSGVIDAYSVGVAYNTRAAADVVIGPNDARGLGFWSSGAETIEFWVNIKGRSSSLRDGVPFLNTLRTDDYGDGGRYQTDYSRAHTRVGFFPVGMKIAIYYLGFSRTVEIACNIVDGNWHFIKIDRNPSLVPNDKTVLVYIDGIWQRQGSLGVDNSTETAEIPPEATAANNYGGFARPLFEMPRNTQAGIDVFFHDLVVSNGVGRFGNFGIPACSPVMDARVYDQLSPPGAPPVEPTPPAPVPNVLAPPVLADLGEVPPVDLVFVLEPVYRIGSGGGADGADGAGTSLLVLVTADGVINSMDPAEVPPDELHIPISARVNVIVIAGVRNEATLVDASIRHWWGEDVLYHQFTSDVVVVVVAGPADSEDTGIVKTGAPVELSRHYTSDVAVVVVAGPADSEDTGIVKTGGADGWDREILLTSKVGIGIGAGGGEGGVGADSGADISITCVSYAFTMTMDSEVGIGIGAGGGAGVDSGVDISITCVRYAFTMTMDSELRLSNSITGGPDGWGREVSLDAEVGIGIGAGGGVGSGADISITCVRYAFTMTMDSELRLSNSINVTGALRYGVSMDCALGVLGNDTVSGGGGEGGNGNSPEILPVIDITRDLVMWMDEEIFRDRAVWLDKFRHIIHFNSICAVDLDGGFGRDEWHPYGSPLDHSIWITQADDMRIGGYDNVTMALDAGLGIAGALDSGLCTWDLDTAIECLSATPDIKFALDRRPKVPALLDSWMTVPGDGHYHSGNGVVHR